MRIAFLSLMAGLPWGGSEALWHAIAMYSLDQGDEVFVSVYDWGQKNEKIKLLQAKGAYTFFRKRYDPEAGTLKRITRFIANRKPSLNKDYQSIVDFNPEIVFISQGDSFDLAIHHRSLYNLLRQNNIPYSFICHNHAQYGFLPPKEIYPNAVEIFNNARHVFFISRRQWQLTERRLICRLNNALITWNPMNLQLPLPDMRWPDNEYAQMALVANIISTKGHDTALEVLSTDGWKKRDWLLNIYGDGEGLEYLKRLSKFYDISERVIFHGHVDNIVKVWNKNHLLLIPSAGEGLPISLVEAMACGRPAVVTDVGGNTELIIEGESGFIAASPTVESFSAAMEKAWNDKNNWRKMGKQAQNKINSTVEKFPQIKIYELLKNLIP